MRSIALAVAGLAALSSALPTGSAPDSTEVEKRQVLIPEPSVILTPGSSPSPPKKEFSIPYPFPIPAPGEEPTFQIGRRSGNPSLTNIDSLADAFKQLAAPYLHKHPSLATYLILEHMAALLAAAGHPHKDIIFLGPVETHFQISNKEKRQDGVFGIGGGCNVDDLISLLLTYSSLQAIYGSNPPTQIKNLKEAIYAALKYCNMDPEVGGMIPERPRPGAPIVPDKPTPGAPMVPAKPVQGAPMVPEKPATGAPMVPEKTVQGAPLVPEKPATGAPLVPEKTVEGAPMVPSS